MITIEQFAEMANWYAKKYPGASIGFHKANSEEMDFCPQIMHVTEQFKNSETVTYLKIF